MFDNKGASLIMINTPKGQEVWDGIEESFIAKEKTFSEAFKYNHSKPMPLKPERNALFARYQNEEINQLLLSYNDLKAVPKKK